jgi:hypothetical protein
MLGRLLAALALVLPLPAMAQGMQDMDEAELNYVMLMQFNGCSMTEAEIAAQMQDAGISPAEYEAVAEAIIARGDATVTAEADGVNRVTMQDWACVPVEFGEWEVSEPLGPEEQLAKLQESTYVAVMSSNDCTMTEAEIAAEMPNYGLKQPLYEAVTQTLVGSGAATVSDEADGGKRVTLGPEICVSGASAGTLIAAKPESVAKFTELLLARDCSVGIDTLESIEAELGLEPAETYPIVVVMEVAGEGRMDFENGVFRLINKDCP